MCEFILSTVVNSDDARHESTLNGDIVQDCQLGITTTTGLRGRKRLLEKHSEKLSPLIAYDLPSTFVLAEDVQMLRLVSLFCGIGRVVLIGIASPNVLPCHLRAVVLYPFPALDARDVRKPFIAGQPFELATRIGMQDLISRTVVLLMAIQMTHWSPWPPHGWFLRHCSQTTFCIVSVAGVRRVYLSIQNAVEQEVRSLFPAVLSKSLQRRPLTQSSFAKQEVRVGFTLLFHIAGALVLREQQQNLRSQNTWQEFPFQSCRQLFRTLSNCANR